MIAHGYPSNPAAVLQGAKQAQTLPKTISHEDMQRLLSVYTSEEELERDRAVALRNQAVLELLYACGLRVSEVEGLTLDRLHLDQGYVSVVGKGNKERRVPIYHKAVSALRRYLEESRSELAAHSERATDVCFLSRAATRSRPPRSARSSSRALTLAGLDPSLSPHAMRHSFASDLLVGGATCAVCRKCSGHSSLSTTQIYTHLSPEHLKQVPATGSSPLEKVTNESQQFAIFHGSISGEGKATR